ncbi:hypothetical protein ACVCII_04255 [Burkholderia glumae]|uniref:hypothetical protein n=1 Tax=Burkholderia glumae TaxID=337 RepID=UPI0020367435|nr:hypothetical protein [Burkholderia glumae]MCM2546151.1 hypothetical protein [Burkholderia glumae]
MSENNTTAPALTDEQWLDLASRHANAEWNSTGYLDSIKAVCADFALLTSPRAAVPEGWKLVPIEPTSEMVSAGEHVAYSDVAYAPPEIAYRAMLDAAPAAPVAEAEPAPNPLRRRVERLLVELHAEGRLSEG